MTPSLLLIHEIVANRPWYRHCFESLSRAVALFSSTMSTFLKYLGQKSGHGSIPFPSILSSSTAQFDSTSIQRELPVMIRLLSLSKLSIYGLTSNLKAGWMPTGQTNCCPTDNSSSSVLHARCASLATSSSWTRPLAGMSRRLGLGNHLLICYTASTMRQKRSCKV